MDKSYTYHGVRRQTDRLMNDADQVDVLKEEFGSPGAGLVTHEDPGGAPAARYIQTHTARDRAFAAPQTGEPKIARARASEAGVGIP